jgi:hypothetical protein
MNLIVITLTLENIITTITEDFVPESKALNNSKLLQESRNQQPIQITIEKQAINEMENNDEIFAGSFPTSFFFGIGNNYGGNGLTTGSFPKRLVQIMLS